MIKINIWYDADSTVSLPELLSINIERDSFENQSDLDNYIIDYLMNNGCGGKTNLTWQIL
ncbi:TPA: hypothetical protein QH810_001416 [Klebsiella pneumoniae subsp. pneumoniae]|uniref:Uncharacterized protein n=1 Tax=Klebsiella pneumoniae TaxID=573 RepID=A0A9Q8FCS0_KLEPN|nr:hypothetical protein [Klebsiella pneumoniae]HDT3398354.1 hypothetical protein [Klebsiella pneumoniae subsp. ozaenae]EIV7892912.1 hypothetical protein [Klebsiella pneumoniae]EIX9227946.1 hypothetical protein [Klebsiella pneumoniae]KDJ49786.1 hypothetical protein AE99_02766 [Klebsiella pneumoniae CHS 43]KDJ71855.1 hypothetical protein AF04_02981 [Klebsiella pneumoniae CHS 48]